MNKSEVEFLGWVFKTLPNDKWAMLLRVKVAFSCFKDLKNPPQRKKQRQKFGIAVLQKLFVPYSTSAKVPKLEQYKRERIYKSLK